MGSESIPLTSGDGLPADLGQTPADVPAPEAPQAAATYDVFVSHSSKDKDQAAAICAEIEANGLRCWIAPRDIGPGRLWDEAIMDGIASSRVLLLVYSANANRSADVAREIVHATRKRIPILPFRLQDVKPSKAIEYHLVQSQWLDAFPPPIETHFAKLVDAVRDLVNRPLEATDTLPAQPQPVELPTPRLRELRAVAPLFALDVLVGTWVGLHARWAIEWVAANVALGALAVLLWNVLPNATTDDARREFALALRSRKLARLLWGTVVAFVALTAFVSTVQISSPGLAGSQAPVTVHLYDQEIGSALGAGATPADSVRLMEGDQHHSIMVWTSPLGRRLWLATSPRVRTRPLRVMPWVPEQVVYPVDFAGPATLSVLLWGTLIPDVSSRPRPRIVIISQAAPPGSAPLAEDTVGTMGGLLFSDAEPPAPDSATRARWIANIQSRVHADTAAASQIVGEWTHTRWIPTRRALHTGDRLRVALVAASGDTLASDTLTLTSPASDVYLDRRQ